MAKIGFVGLGHMGFPMAINLIQAGHLVQAYDIQTAACEAFAAEGGVIAKDLKSVAEDAEVLITMLQTGEQVESVCLPSDGLFTYLKPGSLYLDCSTIDVKTSRKIHEIAASKNFFVVDAPVSGGVAAAKAASLTFMVGGEGASFQKAFVILQAMGQKIIHTGLAGSGQAAKICNNMILGVSMVAVSEAFVLAETLGLAKEKLFEVVNNASGQCWVMSKYVPVPGLLEQAPANHDYQPGFSANMMLKDLTLSAKAMEDAGLLFPTASASKSLYEYFCEQGKGDLDFSAIIKVIK